MPKDWASIGLADWKLSHDSFLFESQIMLEQFSNSRTIPTQPFSRLFKRIQCHSTSEERNIFPKLSTNTQNFLRNQHTHLDTIQGMTFFNKAAWLRNLIKHIQMEEELVWQHLNKQEALHK